MKLSKLSPRNSEFQKKKSHVIACALSSGAKYLVTGDAELLGIKRYKKLRILSPRDFELLFD